jgi:curved DNA-binding protein CbpA
MDRIRRSFLRSTDDVYYKLLGLSDRNASQAAIKEAFLKLSAACHPYYLSKIGVDLTPANITKFLKVHQRENVPICFF